MLLERIEMHSNGFNPFTKNVRTVWYAKELHSRHTHAHTHRCHKMPSIFDKWTSILMFISIDTAARDIVCSCVCVLVQLFRFLELGTLARQPPKPIDSNKFFTKSPLRQIQTICRTLWIYCFYSWHCHAIIYSKWIIIIITII